MPTAAELRAALAKKEVELETINNDLLALEAQIKEAEAQEAAELQEMAQRSTQLPAQIPSGSRVMRPRLKRVISEDFVDQDVSRNTEVKPKAKGEEKSKAKVETSRVVKYTGDDRCRRCVVKKLECKVIVIEKWEEGVAAGKDFQGAPSGLSCTECRRGKMCLLPRKEGLRYGMGEKREREELETDKESDGEPRQKKRRLSDESAYEPVPSWEARLVGLFSALERGLDNFLKEQKRSTCAQIRIARAVERIADKWDAGGVMMLRKQKQTPQAEVAK